MPKYRAEDVIVNIDGDIVTGLAEGSYVESGRNTEKREFQVGAQGNVIVNESADDTGYFNLTLQETSPFNDVLRALFNSGDEFSISVTDRNTNAASSSASEAYVADLPENEKAEEAEDREWPIIAVDYEEE